MAAVITGREIKVLEFDEIRQSLASLAASPMARQMAEQLTPSADHGFIQKQQRETSEGRLLFSKNAFTPSAVEDIKQLLSRADKGALLSGSELAAVLSFIKASRRWSAFFKNSDNRLLYPSLADLALQIRNCQELASSLESSLDQDGNVLDSASPALSSIRRKKLSFQSKIREKLDEYMRSANYRRYLQDPLVTIRGGRYVLPVKQEYRQHVAGLVHDQSSSGATLFIEPLPVVQMQNELTAIQRREEEEIERILFTLSGQVATASVDLAQNRSLYAELDFIVARGRYSYETGSTEPALLSNEKPILHLTHAIHPLLSGEKIPLTVELGGEAQTLVITGPNTGGKTVALKTIGLMAAMAQSGLHLPAGKETKVSVFSAIRADIGDEQSIAQSLSTFSGHMKNLIEIITESSPGVLVLLDELGAGTDPSEGSALAMAILGELTHKGALTVATTHINELKLFAQVQENMQNAAMEFDPDTLAPTYKLLQGVPGQSNAFYIAEELGLPRQVLKKAKSFVHRSHDQVETIIASLVQDQQRLHRDSRQAAFERSRAEILMEELEKEQELLRARRDDILQEAREEARQIIKGAKNAADQVIKELRGLKYSKNENTLARAEELRREMNLIRRDIESDEDEAVSELSCLAKEDLAVGQIVYINSLKQRGEIVTFSDDEALVQIGSIKVHLPLHELRQEHKKDIENLKKGKKINKRGYSVRKDLAISNSIDLRGLNLEEARPLVDKLLDNALWAGLNKVDLIHGKGTGKLKMGLRDYLKEHPLVSTFRSGSSAEGGEGVTVVEIKS